MVRGRTLHLVPVPHHARSRSPCSPRLQARARLAPPSGGPVSSRGSGAGLRKPRREGWRGCRPIGATSPRIRHGIPDVGLAHMSCERDRRLRTGRVFAGRGGPRIPLAQGSWIASSSAARRSTSDLPTPEGRGTERHAKLHPDIAAESQRVLGQHQNAAGKPLCSLSPSTSHPPLPESFRTLPWQRQALGETFPPVDGRDAPSETAMSGTPTQRAQPVRKRAVSSATWGSVQPKNRGQPPSRGGGCSSTLRGCGARAPRVRIRREPAPFADDAGSRSNLNEPGVSGRALRGSARRPGPEGPAGPRERPGR